MGWPSSMWLPSREFWYGVSSALALVVVRAVRQFFQVPTLTSIQALASAPIPVLTWPPTSPADTKEPNIVIYGYQGPQQHPGWKQGIVDQSYYVSRVEAWLRLQRLPYRKCVSQGGRENPRGKVPFAQFRLETATTTGKAQDTTSNTMMMDDSTRIIEYLRNHYQGQLVTSTVNLTDSQLAMQHLIQTLLSGSLYWVLCHYTFETQAGRQEFALSLARDGHVPSWLQPLIRPLVFRRMHEEIVATGLGLKPEAEIARQGQEDLLTLSRILGQQSFMLGTSQPTPVDADCYAALIPLFGEPTVACGDFIPWLPDMKRQCPNLVDYVIRMRKILFPELGL